MGKATNELLHAPWTQGASEALSVKHEAVENEGQVHFQSEKEYSHVASFIDRGFASRMHSTTTTARTTIPRGEALI